MKKLIICLLALSLVALYSCKKEEVEPNGSGPTPTNNNGGNNNNGGGNNGGNNNNGGDNGGNNGGGTQQSIADQFMGQWNLATTTTAHITGNVLEGIYSIDSMMSITDATLSLSIAKVSETQVTITGSLQLLPSATFNFTTTGTISEAGMAIPPVELSGTYGLPVPAGMGNLLAGVGLPVNIFNADGSVDVNYTGTLTFNNPIAIPSNGVMTVNSSLITDGSRGINMVIRQINILVATLDANAITSTGSRSSK